MSFSKPSSSSDLGVQNTVDELVAELFHLLGQGQVTCFKLLPKMFMCELTVIFHIIVLRDVSTFENSR